MPLDKILVIIGGVGLIIFIIKYFLMRPEERAEAKSGKETQEATIIIERGYSPETVEAKRDVPLKLKFDRRETESCSERLLIPEFKVNQFLPPNAITEISFTPDKAGEFEFRCGMGMLHGKLIVR